MECQLETETSYSPCLAPVVTHTCKSHPQHDPLTVPSWQAGWRFTPRYGIFLQLDCVSQRSGIGTGKGIRIGYGSRMNKKPTILFIAIVPPEYAPSNIERYAPERSFELIPHKHSVLALVAWLREKGCEGHYVWGNPGDGRFPMRVEKAIEEIGPDAIGFSLVTEELLLHYKLIESLKAAHPDIPIIVGGPHTTHQPAETLGHFPLVDYVAIGEGEMTLAEWLQRIASGRGVAEMSDVAGLAYRDESGKVVITAPRERFSDMNVLPDPAFDLIAAPDAPPSRNTAFPLVGSYGCRYFCTFCAADHGNYRFMTPERLVNQIQRAQEKFGVEYFAIRDSCWPPSSEWLDEFCDEIERRGLRIQFHFETRAGTLSEEQWARLKRIGLQGVGVGVESGDPEILKAIKKAITVDMARKTFAALHKVGIVSVAFFMVGNQGETWESVKRSIALMRELNPTLLSIATFRPLPGTEAYALVKEEDRDWWMRGPYPSICELPTETLHRIREDVHVRYPLRWAYLRQNVFGGNLPPQHRALAWRCFVVNLRRYILGVAERSRFGSSLIRGAKVVLKRK